MKKLIVGALCAMLGIASYAAGEAYHVYRFQFSAKTTDAKGISTVCGCSDYAYREKRLVTIQGYLAGCGCGAIEANGTCQNAILYMWDATHKVAITNVEMTIPWVVQRSGKKLTTVEHFASMKATYGEDDRYSFEIMMSGFGNYVECKKTPELSYVSSISGYFSGVAGAATYVKPGVVSACYSEPGAEFATTAFTLCTACSESGLEESEYKSLTPFFGMYGVKYDANLSKKVSKNGITQLTGALPSYVGAFDYVATNIGIED